MKVSIIIPVYQVAPYIEDCLRSVMRQTYTGRMECLLIDDGGTDDSIAIAERMIVAYDGPIRFEIFHHEQNRGLSEARNTGLIQANGEYIFFLDSDDEISDNCIELLMERVEEDSSIELVQGGTKGKRSGKVTQTTASSNDEVRKCFFQSEAILVTAWNKLIRRSFLTEHYIMFHEGFSFEDTPWMFNMLKFLTKVSFVTDITYYYKKRADSIVSSASAMERARSFRYNYNYILKNLTSGHEREEYRYYTPKFAYVYAKYSHVVTAYKDDYPQWKEKAREYGNSLISLRLSASRMIGKWKYGWLLLFALSRITHPDLIRVDLVRITYRDRNKFKHHKI